MRGVASVPLLASVALVLTLLAGCSSPDAGAAAEGPDFTGLDLDASSTTGVIRGIVVDQAIRPVEGATVTLTPGDKTATSTEAGTFGFESLEPGLYFVRADKPGFNASQTSTEVVAGVAEPAIVKVLIQQDLASTPYVEASMYEGFMTCGFAVFVTSAGCDTSTAEQFGDTVYFLHEFTTLPAWTQGELVWEQTQAAGGGFIWQIAKPGTNDYYSAGETGPSPVLAFIDNATLEENSEDILDTGAEYRVFGGPHPSCVVANEFTPYGCGVTFNQKFNAYVHSFYNFMPELGWRFTANGAPVVPT